MSDPSSASKQMLTALSEIEPIAFYFPSSTGLRSNIPTSSPPDNPENHFHSIDLNSSSVFTGPGPHHEMLSDALFEGDLPRNKTSESNILAASEEFVIESLDMMREEVRVEESEPFQNEDMRETQPIFDSFLDFGRHPSSDSSDSASDERSIQWRVEKRDVSASKKGKENVVGEVSKRRPTTRSHAKKMMVDALKSSAKSKAENRSARTFKVTNFKLPESCVIDVSIEQTEKGYRKKKSGKIKPRDTKKAEQTKSTKETSKVKRKRSQGRGTQRKIEEHVNKQDTVENLRKQSVLAGRRKCVNFTITFNFRNTRVNDINVHLDETLLGKILRVPRDGTRSVVGKTYSVEFVTLYSKLPTMKYAGLFKKVMKSAYQVAFEFVNKTLLSRTEKRTSATYVDLYVMELLCKFEPLILSYIMLEHMYETVIERKGIHGRGYGYFLTEVFKHFNISLGVGKVGTVKQVFSETTLVECECIEGKGNPKRKMAQLIEDQEQLKHEFEELTMRLSGKDTEIAILKSELLTAQTEGPGTVVVQALERENAELRAKVIALQEKIIKDNDD
ncbi:hypothetical protein EJD97_008651, partial [Solanum chilense]